jgi:hypothetical protein
MLRKFVTLIAGLTLCVVASASQQTIVTTPGIATNAPAAGALINANFSELYGFFNGQLFLLPSGDATGARDLANLNAALASMAATFTLPTGFSSYQVGDRIVLGPGNFFFTSGRINLLGPVNAVKISGIWLQGSGRGVTNIDYNPSVSGPLLINNRGLDVKFTDLTFTGHDPNSDFYWSQEQNGLTNVQDETFQDVEWTGSWYSLFRLTGGNNNSEWKFTRDTGAGTITNGIYVPASIAVTITSGSSTIAATNTAEQVEVGDTGGFTSACAPLSANTGYFVVAASTSGFQVSTTSGGTPVTFTANCTPSFTAGSDQFLNFWFDKFKWDTGTSPGQWINMSYGGSIKIRDSDMSNHAPSSVAYAFNLLGTLSGPHAGGVMNFEVDGLRVEHASTNSRLIHSQWTNGTITFNNLDESSQVGHWPITNAYAFYEIVNNNGPLINYSNSQMMGLHNYTNNVSNYQRQINVEYQNITLLENPSFSNFITVTNVGNTGGYPRIHCDNCRNSASQSVVGYKEQVDSDLFWNSSYAGTTKTKTVACVGANSDWPSTAGGSFQIRLPLNAMILDIKYWNPSGSAGSATAYNFLIETTDASPTVLATISGANAATPVPASAMQGNTAVNFVMSTDTARTIQIKENAGRASIFTGMYCLIDYIG